MFVDTLTASDKYPVTICSSLLKRNYLKKEKLFVDFLFHLSNLHQILKIFKKNLIVKANIFPRLQTLKDLVRPLSKKDRLRTSVRSQHVERFQTLVKYAWERFYHIFLSLWELITWKIYLLFNFEILEVFVKTLTADEKYPVLYYQNLQFPIQL